MINNPLLFFSMVSIPDRDFSGFQPFKEEDNVFDVVKFQSLIGILVDFNISD